MPVVRRAERTVESRPLVGGQRRAAATPESEGAGLERAKADKFGAVAGFGGHVAETGIRMYALHEQDARRMREEARDSANQTAAIGASNRLSEWHAEYFYHQEHGAFLKKGKDALTLPEEARASFESAAGAIEAGLANDDQRLAFSKLRAQTWQSSQLDVLRHVTKESRDYQASELSSLIDNKVNEAQQSALDPKMVAVHLQTAVSALRTNGPKVGMGPEEIDAKQRAVQTKVHVGVISNLLAQEQDQKAATYYAATKGQIDGDQQDAIQKALDEGTLRGQSQKAADTILREGGTLTEQRAKAKAIDDPKLRDQVENRIEHEAAIRDRVEREQETETMRQGYDLLDRGADVTKIPPALWSNYSGATRSAMRAYAIQRAKGVPIETDLPTYYGLMQKAGSDPEAFVTTNLLQYRGKLDDVEFKQLTGLQLSMQRSDTKAADKDLAPFQTRSQLLDNTLTLHGIDPNAKPGTPEGQAIAQLRRMVDRRVEFLQDSGKKATNADIQSEIDGLLSQSVTVPGSWWNIFPGGRSVSDTSKRLLNLTIGDVPATDRAQIEAALRARGRAVSDATVLDLYLETQVRRKK